MYNIGPYYHLRITLVSFKIYLRFDQPYLSKKYSSGPYYHLCITLFSLKIYLRFVQPYLSRKYLRCNTII